MKIATTGIAIILIFLVNQIVFAQVGLVNEVNPFIGTSAHGHTYPGATLPFGLVQLSPDTRLDGWDGCSGYHFSDTIIYGFSHTHLSGTGCSDYGDVMLMPFEGEGSLNPAEYCSVFSHSDEKATPGFYSVILKKNSIKCELTASLRTGMHRYIFHRDNSPSVILDLNHRDKLLESWVEILPNGDVVGLRRSSAWASDQKLFFCIRFNKVILKTELYKNNKICDGNRVSGNNIKVVFRFASLDDTLMVKVGISGVDEIGARKNIEIENPIWNFDSLKMAAVSNWNFELGKIGIEGGKAEDRTIFYTALYHCMLSPNIFSDTDGRYRGRDDNIHEAKSFNYYTVFSLWDTYRALHPLFTLIDQKRTIDFIKTFLAQYEQCGRLPVWELWANETNCMIAYHSVSVISDAYIKGNTGFDANKALEAMQKSANDNNLGLDTYKEYQFIAADKEHESVSKTLEYAYDDWCIAQMAKTLGNEQVHSEFIKRAQFYKNLHDPVTGFMRARYNGRWAEPFNPTEVNNYYTEANAWQYSFYVPHDISTWMANLGGFDILNNKLDQLFSSLTITSGRTQVDITGMIGQYAQGNEPSHHIAYLYNFCLMPWKTQHIVHKIRESQYFATPDGICGNDDCGQMSAWYIFSALGFYPVCPGNQNYVIGTPLFPKASISFENGNKLIIDAQKRNSSDIFIQSANWNNVSLEQSFLLHNELLKGGYLNFKMGDKPNRNLWNRKEQSPPSIVDTLLIIKSPWFEYSNSVFKDSVYVKIKGHESAFKIYYFSEKANSDSGAVLYTTPFYVSKSCKINAFVIGSNNARSPISSAIFCKMDKNINVELFSKYNSQYHAGGPDGLIDGVRGNTNWRLGGWQGYQDSDFEALLDLGSIRTGDRIGAGFLQDARSWIWMPVQLEISVSDDKIDFKDYAVVYNQLADTCMDVVSSDFLIAKPFKARYIRFKAKNFGTIPLWHPGSGSKAFIFIDELLIE